MKSKTFLSSLTLAITSLHVIEVTIAWITVMSSLPFWGLKVV